MNLRVFAPAAVRAALCTVIFSAGLGGVAWAIRQALPFPEIPIVRQKIERLAADRDYDTLFFGSSRIQYQVIPAIFDRLAAEQGLPTRSFNAGIAAMNPPEDAFFLDSILRHPPKNLRWVFIELSALRTVISPERIATVRADYWHDWPRVRLLFERALVTKPSRKKRNWRKELDARLTGLGEFVDHLPLFLKYQTNLGRGSLLTWYLMYTRKRSEPPLEKMLGEDLAGWIRTGRPELMSGALLADYERALGERQSEPARPSFGDSVSQKALGLMIAKIEKFGGTPVLVVPPTTNKHNFYPLPERVRKSIVLDFGDMQKFPELYEKRHRIDADHLNAAGAELFTQLLAKEWAREVRRRQ